MTSDYRKSSDDDNSINDSSLSDAIADILNLSEDDMKPAKKLDKKSLTSNLIEVPHSNDTAEPTSNRHSVGDDDNESGTPPMPEFYIADVYLSSESLDLAASLASLSNSYEDRVRYDEDFDDYFETESTATDYDIPSICSSASPSTHDFSLMSDDNVLELGHVDYLEDVTYNFVAQTAPLDPSVGCNNAGGPQESPISCNNIQKNDSPVTSDLIQVQQTMEYILSNVVAKVVGYVIINIEEEEFCTVAKETPVDDLVNDLAISTNGGDISNDRIASTLSPTDTPITKYYSIENDNLIGCDFPQNDHSVSTASSVYDYSCDPAKSSNEADFSDETYDDASSISYPETMDNEDSSIDDNFLGHTDYSKVVKSCISQKVTEFLNDCQNVSEDSDDTDNIPASSCHVASDSTSISEKCSIAADSDDEPVADHPHVFRSTTSSFHVAKEDSTSASEASSIAEAILPADSDDDESVSFANCVKNMDTNISFAKVEPTTDLHMNKITTIEGTLEQEPENNSNDTSVFSSPSTSSPVVDKSTSTSLTANNDTNSPDKQINSKEVELIEDERRQLQYHITHLTYQCNYLHRANESLTNEAVSLRSKFHTLILDKEKIAKGAYANSVKKDVFIEALKKDVHWWTYETKYAEEAKESLSAEVEALKQNSVEQKTKEESLLKENARLKEQLEKFSSLTNDEVLEMQRTIDGHKNKAENLAQQNATLKEQLEKVKTTSEEEIQKLKSTIDGLNSNNENLTEQKIALKEQLEKVSSTSEEKIKALTSTVDNQNIIVDTLQQDNRSLKDQLEDVSLLSKEKVQKLESDYQELLSHTNKLQLKNATLQRYIEERRFHSHSDTDGITYHDDIIQGSVDTNNDDSIKFEIFTTSTMSSPTPTLSTTPTMSSTTCLTPAVTELNPHQETPSEIPEQARRTPLVATPNEIYAAAKWQESFKSMFENQRRQFASFQHQIMTEILGLQKQLSTKSNAVTAETLSCLQAATSHDEHFKLSERVTTLEDEITSLKRQVNKLDKTNTRNEELSKEKESKIECLIGVVNAITANINKLKQEKNEWKSIASKHQSTIVQLKEQNTTNVTLIEEQYHQYKTKTDKLINDMNTDLYNKGRELESVEHKLQMSNITASQVPKLEQHLEAAQNNINPSSSQLDEKSNTCQRLQTEAVEANVVGLRQRYHNLADKLAAIEQQLKNVRQEKKVTAEKLTKTNLKITQMKINMDNLITENLKREVKYSDRANVHKDTGLKEMKPKTGIWAAGDANKAHADGETVKAPKPSGLGKTSTEI